MQCKTSYIDDQTGKKIVKPKKVYETLGEAIRDSQKLNMIPNRVCMVVPYKCKKCEKFHVGKNHEKITEEYRDARTITAKDSLSKVEFKIIGKIELKPAKKEKQKENGK